MCLNSAYPFIFWIALWNPDHEERTWARHQVLQRAHRYPGRSRHMQLLLIWGYAFPKWVCLFPSCDFFCFSTCSTDARGGTGRQSSSPDLPTFPPITCWNHGSSRHDTSRLTFTTVALFCPVLCVRTIKFYSFKVITLENRPLERCYWSTVRRKK